MSKEEYETDKDIIPLTNGWWWLRSPGYVQTYVTCVGFNGFIIDYYHNIYDNGCVRPALYIWNHESSNLNRGDKFELAGYTWTMLSGDLALCDDNVDTTYFCKYRKPNDSNDYEKSDIKIWLHNWACRNDIEFMMQTFSPDDE